MRMGDQLTKLLNDCTNVKIRMLTLTEVGLHQTKAVARSFGGHILSHAVVGMDLDEGSD